jgi:hypothetical protein
MLTEKVLPCLVRKSALFPGAKDFNTTAGLSPLICGVEGDPKEADPPGTSGTVSFFIFGVIVLYFLFNKL